MTENTSNEVPEDNEPTVLFGIQTPLGMMEVDLADLPEALRESIAKSLDAQGLPKAVHAAFTKALGVEAESRSTGDPGRDSRGIPEDVTDPLHAAGCSGANTHKEQVWGIADSAFPNDPHLWKTLELLFSLSAVNPEEITDEARHTTLNEAARHLNHHIEQSAPPLSPDEQMIANFRKRLGI